MCVRIHVYIIQLIASYKHLFTGSRTLAGASVHRAAREDANEEDGDEDKPGYSLQGGVVGGGCSGFE